MRIPYPPIFVGTIVAAAILGSAAGAGEAKAASETSAQPAIQSIDDTWCRDLGDSVECMRLDGTVKSLSLGDGRSSVTVNSRLRTVVTQDGTVVKESLETLNEQFRFGARGEFYVRQVSHLSSKAPGEQCVTTFVFRETDFGELAIDHLNGPGCS